MIPTFIPLLLAGLYAEGETLVKEAAKSRNHTELMLNYFGADIITDGIDVKSHPVENLNAQRGNLARYFTSFSSNFCLILYPSTIRLSLKWTFSMTVS